MLISKYLTFVLVNIKVLTTGFWPNYPIIELNLPEEIVKQKSLFETYYLTRYQGRRLTWQHSLDRYFKNYSIFITLSCVMTARFPKGKKELEVSLSQVFICYSFINRKGYSNLKF